MNSTLAALWAGALLAAALPAQAQQSLNPSQVASISSEDVALGDQFLTFNWASEAANVGLLSFDLSTLNAPVGLARLDLYHQFNAGPGAVFALYANTSAWSADLSLWSERPGHLAQASTLITIDDAAEGLWRSADVTATVNAWISGALPNYGFTLARVDQANPYVYFSSSAIGGGAAPVLTLSPVPEPQAALLLASGLLVLAWRRRSVRQAG